MRLPVGVRRHRKNESKAWPRLNSRDRFHVGSKRNIGQNGVISMIRVIQLCRSIKFDDRDQLLRCGNGKLVVWNGIAEDEPVFEILQASIQPTTRKRRVAKY